MFPYLVGPPPEVRASRKAAPVDAGFAHPVQVDTRAVGLNPGYARVDLL